MPFAPILLGLLLLGDPGLRALGTALDRGVEPGRGVALVASPHLEDPRFHHAVVVLLEHGPAGSLGLVVNKPLGVEVTDALPQLEPAKRRSHELHFGGPVSRANVLFLFRSDENLPRSEPIVADLRLSGEETLLRTLLERDTPVNRLRVFSGYAGWGAGQLEAEIERGDWATLRAEPTWAFAPDAEFLWESLLEAGSPEGTLVLGPIRPRIP